MSNITTCAVTGIIHESEGGVPAVGATIEVQLAYYDIYQGFVAPEKTIFKTDENGEVVMDLFPNQLGQAASFYEVRIKTKNKTFKTIAVVPNQPTAFLHEIVDLPPYEGQPTGAIILARVEALLVLYENLIPKFLPNAPPNPLPGSRWTDADTGKTYEWVVTASSAAWLEVGSAETIGYETAIQAAQSAEDAAASAVDAQTAEDAAKSTLAVFAAVPPANPLSGRRWTNSDTGKTYEWIVDADGGQWVETGSAQTVSATAFSNALSASNGATMVGFQQAGAGSVTRTAEDKMRDFVHCKDKGVVGGGADDTLAVLNAWAYCRENGKVLVLEGQIRFVAASVPNGSKTAGFGGDYVPGSSMVGFNAAELIVEGKIGINLAGINRTVLEGFKVSTTGREATEAQLENTTPYLFASLSGTKESAVYQNVSIIHGVTNTTGAYRAGPSIVETGCASLLVSNVRADNCTIPLMAFNSTNVSIENLYGANIQTGIYLSIVQRYNIRNVSHINTQSQYGAWVARTAGTPRAVNGMDTVCIEFGGHGVVSGLDAAWPHERVTYIQSNNVQISDSKVRNGDGFKAIGSNRSNIGENIYITNCHQVLDADFAVGVGRSAPEFSSSYWSKNVLFEGCTQRDNTPSGAALRSFCTLGGYDTTQTGLRFKNCIANAQTFAYVKLMPYTAAQLAAIDPTQTFYVIDGLTIENCHLNKSPIRAVGSWVEVRDTEASADAKATYGVKNVAIRNNVLNNSAANGQDDWLFDPRYMDGVTSEHNIVSNAFINTLFVTAPNAPYRNLLMREPFLKSSVSTSVLLARMANLNALTGTQLNFRAVITGVVADVSTMLAEDGALSLGLKVIELTGKGYWQNAAAIDCGIEMRASGTLYAGKAVSGVKTDQVSTPPVGIVASAGNLEVRGDLAPTVKYRARFQVIA